MTRVMELSILAFLLSLSAFAAGPSAPSLRQSSVKLGAAQSSSARSGPANELKTKKAVKALGSQPGPSSRVENSQWNFLEQAEDIEREAWWVLTDQRWEGSTSAFRILRAAFLKQSADSKSKLRIKFCQKLRVHGPEAQVWRVESECQKIPQEVGRLQKLNQNTWKVEWRTGQLTDHFGLGTSILFTKLSCEIRVGSNGRIQKMSCPGYARNRTGEEIVELKVFEYDSSGASLLKLKGDVKKDLQVIATLQSEVPLAGDVVVKEKQIPQKPVEETTDFSDSKSQVKKSQTSPNVQAQGNGQDLGAGPTNSEDSNREKESQQEGFQKDPSEIGENNRGQNPLPKSRQEIRNQSFQGEEPREQQTAHPEGYIQQGGPEDTPEFIEGERFEPGHHPGSEPSQPAGPPPIEVSPTGR